MFRYCSSVGYRCTIPDRMTVSPITRRTYTEAPNQGENPHITAHMRPWPGLDGVGYGAGHSGLESLSWLLFLML
jgi:hypothetical protein